MVFNADTNLYLRLGVLRCSLSFSVKDPLFVQVFDDENDTPYPIPFHNIADERTIDIIRQRSIHPDAVSHLNFHSRFLIDFRYIFYHTDRNERDNVAEVVSLLCSRLKDYSNLISSHQRDNKDPFLCFPSAIINVRNGQNNVVDFSFNRNGTLENTLQSIEEIEASSYYFSRQPYGIDVKTIRGIFRTCTNNPETNYERMFSEIKEMLEKIRAHKT